MAEKLSAADAAARLEATDTLGIPLATGQAPAFMAALGERDDWDDLRVYGALLGVGTTLFNHKNVHYLSGFYGPFERPFATRARTSASPRRTFAGSRRSRNRRPRDGHRRGPSGRRRLVLALAARGRRPWS